MGHRFTGVRMHRDASAGAAALALNAQAFAIGHDVMFAPGRFDPADAHGSVLLAHELAHVAQQSASQVRTLQRQDHAVPAARISPADAVRRDTEAISIVLLPRVQAALDGLSDSAMQNAGQALLERWTTMAATADSLGLSLDHAQTSAEAGAAPANDPDLQPAVDAMRREILNGMTAQRLGSRWVLGREHEVSYPGTIGQYISDQTAELAWLLRDGARLLVLLATPSLREPDQWTAIGLLRQHMGACNFAFLMAAVDARQLRPALDAFAAGPAAALALLTGAQVDIAARPDVQPWERTASLRLMLAEGKVALAEPQTPIEITQQLYGSSAWQQLLRPYNHGPLAGKEGGTLLPHGTELFVDVPAMREEYRAFFAAGAAAHEASLRSGSEAYIQLASTGPFVVGNTPRFTVVLPNSAYESASLEWGIHHDPAAVRQGAPEWQRGPRGWIIWVPQPGQHDENVSWAPELETPGSHTVHCLVQVSRDNQQVASRSITVMSLEDRTELASRAQLPPRESPRDEARRLAGSTAAAEVERRDRLTGALRQADEESRLYLSHDATLSPLTAVYVSSAGEAAAVPLSLNVGRDPGYFDALQPHFKLWDFTLAGPVPTFPATAEHPDDAFQLLLRTHADDAPYPTGMIRYMVPGGMLDSRVHGGVFTYPTDGGTMAATVLRGFSVASLGLAIGSAAIGQVEFTVPLLWLSGALAGLGGAASLLDRQRHGTLEWDVQTGLDVLDITAAVLSLGTSSGATSVAVGTARYSLRGSLQVAVGRAQIGVMVGLHLSQINAAARSGDQRALNDAILHAIADGALILIVHRVSAAGPHGASERSARPGEPRPTPGERSLAEWVQAMRAGALTEGPAPAASAPEGPLHTIDSAHQQYRLEVAHNPDREVGIFHHPDIGEFRVVVGDARAVSPPEPAGWDAVIHYHPNRGNVLTYRMPAPADIDATLSAARNGRRTLTEFVEYPLPQGGIGYTTFTVQPEPLHITVEFTRPNGERVSRSYRSMAEYQSAYSSRTTAVVPGSPEHQALLDDLHDYYTPQAEPSQTRTMAGSSRPPTPAAPERVVSRRLEQTNAPEGWRILSVTERTQPDVVPPPPERTVLEFPDGTRYWRIVDVDSPRNAPVFLTLYESYLGPPRRRADRQRGMPSRGEMSQAFRGKEPDTGPHEREPMPDADRLHPLGSGTGSEARYGFAFGEGRLVNQMLQNAGIEEFLRQLVLQAPQFRFRAVVAVRRQPLTLRMQWTEYRVIAERAGQSQDFFSVRINRGDPGGQAAIHLTELGTERLWLSDLALTNQTWAIELVEQIEASLPPSLRGRFAVIMARAQAARAARAAQKPAP